MNQPTDFVESPGAVLASARVRAGLSLSDVAERSRVGLHALEAIEADDWDALPALVYARGFMRLYAREVGVDPDAVVARMDAMLEGHTELEEEIHEQVEADERRAWWEAARFRVAYAGALGALIIAVVITMFAVAPKTLEAAPQAPADTSADVTFEAATP